MSTLNRKWKENSLQHVVDYVKYHPDRKEALRDMEISESGYFRIIFVLANATNVQINAIENNESPITRTYNELCKHSLCKSDPLARFSEDEKKVIGKVKDRVAHLITWGRFDMKIYIEHLGHPCYGTETEQKAMSAHGRLMRNGFKSNYLQMIGVFEVLAAEREVGTVSIFPTKEKVAELLNALNYPEDDTD